MLEELLLACVVTRHGTASWDSLSMEVQTRSTLATRPDLTPHSFHLLWGGDGRAPPRSGGGGMEVGAS